MSRARESPKFPSTDCLMVPIQNNLTSTTTKRTCQAASAPSTVKPSPRRVAVLLTSPYEWGSGPTAGSDSIASPCALAEWRSKKPECSYAVLIGIAMRAAQAANHGDRLPVIDIYRFIEEEFPYFKNCKSSGWKNCVRHCLSLGQFFRKVERSVESVAIKGNYWEVIPEKKPLLNRDIEVFVLEEHKKFVQRHKKFNAALATKNSNSSSQRNRVLRVTLSPHPPISHPTLSYPSIDSPSSHPPLTIPPTPPSHPPTHSSHPHPPSSHSHLSIPHSPSSHVPTHSSHPHPPSSHPTTTTCVLAQLQQSNSSQISSIRDTGTESEAELSPFTTPQQDTAQNKLPVIDTVTQSHFAPPTHVPTLLCPHGTTTALCDCSTSIDKEDPLPCVSTEAQYTKGHVPKKDDNNEDDSFSVTGSEVEKQRDCCSSEMYIFPGVVASPHSSSTNNAQNSKHIALPSSSNESDEKEESPLINPNHPVVNNGTLASINGIIAVSDSDVAEFMTTSSMSYVMSPYQTKATLCHSSPSRSFVSKIPHSSIFCSPPNSIRKHNHITLYQSLLSPPRLHRRTHKQFKEDRIPPHVRPVLTHMNDPSHFLPSSHFYSIPPYRGKHVCSDSVCNGGGSRKVEASAPGRSGTHTDVEMRNKDSERGKKINTNLRQVCPTLPQPQQRCEQKPQPQSKESSIVHTRRGSCYQQTNTITDHDLLTAEHQHKESISRHLDLAIESTHGEQFFEVGTDWMKLTIGREEEVESFVM